MRYTYLRVSTGKQEDSGLGLEAQRHACHRWSESNGGGENLEFIDIITGTDRKRKELEERPRLLELLSLLKKGDVVIVHKRERLSRDPYVIGMIERIIERKQAKLVSAIGEMDGDQPHNILMRRMMDAFAEYEALLISTRTKAAIERKKARGERVGRVPYGYMLDSNKNITINPYEAEILKEMYTMRVTFGMTLRQIAMQLNVAGYINRTHAKNPIRTWTHGAVARVYKNHIRIMDGLTSVDVPVLVEQLHR